MWNALLGESPWWMIRQRLRQKNSEVSKTSSRFEKTADRKGQKATTHDSLTVLLGDSGITGDLGRKIPKSLMFQVVSCGTTTGSFQKWTCWIPSHLSTVGGDEIAQNKYMDHASNNFKRKHWKMKLTWSVSDPKLIETCFFGNHLLNKPIICIICSGNPIILHQTDEQHNDIQTFRHGKVPIIPGKYYEDGRSSNQLSKLMELVSHLYNYCNRLNMWTWCITFPHKNKTSASCIYSKNTHIYIYIFMLYIMTSLINHHPISFFFAQCTSKLLLEYMNIKAWCAFSSSSSVLKAPKAAPKRRLKSLECTPLAKLNKTSVTVFGGKRRTNCKIFRSELEWTSEELQW